MKIYIVAGKEVGEITAQHLASLSEAIEELGLASAGTAMQIQILGNAMQEVPYLDYHLADSPAVSITCRPEWPSLLPPSVIDYKPYEHSLSLADIQLRPEDVEALQNICAVPFVARPFVTFVTEPIKRYEKPRFNGYMKRAGRRRW